MTNIDPKLKDTLREMEAIMDKYECGGIISLHSKTHTVFKYHLPPWALVEFTPEGNVLVKLRGKTNPQDTDSTFHLLMDSQEVCGRFFMLIEQVVKKVKESGIAIERISFKDRDEHD